MSETAQYMLSTSENIKIISQWVWQIMKETLEMLIFRNEFFISLIIIIIITIICYQFWLKHTNNQETDHLFKVSLISFMILFID